MNKLTYFDDINALFGIDNKNIFIYGAGPDGEECLKSLLASGRNNFSGFIDLRADELLTKLDYHVQTLESYLSDKTEDDFIIITSRVWKILKEECINAQLVESKNFIVSGCFSQLNSPIELFPFINRHYSNPYQSILENGKINPIDNDLALYDYFSNIKGDFTIQEGKYMEHSVVSNKSQSALELGAARGKSSLFLAKGLLKNSGLLTSVDLWSWNTEELKKATQIENGYSPVSKLYRCDFKEEYDRNISFDSSYRMIINPIQANCFDFLNECSDKYDFVFIDLFHTYEETIRVLNAIKKCLTPNAIVLLHDYGVAFPGLMKAVDEKVSIGEFIISNNSCPGSLIEIKWIGNE
jgi:predicted O-methyltransferase YrrM